LFDFAIALTPHFPCLPLSRKIYPDRRGAKKRHDSGEGLARKGGAPNQTCRRLARGVYEIAEWSLIWFLDWIKFLQLALFPIDENIF
jgi:hypothetical protein